MAARVEDPELITGRGRFVADLADERTLHAGFVRSPVSHGVIREIDLSGLEESTARMFAARDLKLTPQPGKLRESLPGHVDYRRPILAEDVVRFAGEAIVLVVGPSEAAVADAIEQIWVEIDELPAAVTVDSAMEDEIILHPVVGTNIAVRATFGTETSPDWTDGPNIELIVESPRVAPAPMEGLSILVTPTGEGFDVVCGSQTPHRLKVAIAESLDVPEDSVRVKIPEVGGAFGQKGAVFVEYLAIARAAQLLQRPVLWAQRRRDNLQAATHGRGARHRIRIGGSPDGTLTQAEIEIICDLGAYPQMGGIVPVTSAALAPGPYHFTRFHVETTGVLTNNTPTGPYRGAGRPEATYALERAVDAYARHIGVDPVVVRRQSLLPPHLDGSDSATGVRYDSGDYRAPLDVVAATLDRDAIRAERQRRIDTGEGTTIGAAITCFVERAGGPPQFGEQASLSIRDDGSLEMSVGSAPSGQGHRTVFGGIVAGAFDVPVESIAWTAGDTEATGFGGGTYGSRSGQLGGSASDTVARELAEKCRHLAAEMLEAAVEDLTFEGGRLVVAGVPGSGVSLAELVGEATVRGIDLSAETVFVASSQTFPYGAHGAIVEIDLDTGDVDVVRIVAVDDCGTILDPMIVSGQVHGSLAQGLGQATLEAISTSENGVLRSSTFMDYLIPTASDVPEWELHHLETPSPSNPLGAKGIGESGTIGLPPAIVNAVLDALEPLGVTHIDMPVTPARVWAAVDAARRARPR